MRILNLIFDGFWMGIGATAGFTLLSLAISHIIFLLSF